MLLLRFPLSAFIHLPPQTASREAVIPITKKHPLIQANTSSPLGTADLSGITIDEGGNRIRVGLLYQQQQQQTEEDSEYGQFFGKEPDSTLLDVSIQSAAPSPKPPQDQQLGSNGRYRTAGRRSKDSSRHNLSNTTAVANLSKAFDDSYGSSNPNEGALLGPKKRDN